MSGVCRGRVIDIELIDRVVQDVVSRNGYDVYTNDEQDSEYELI